MDAKIVKIISMVLLGVISILLGFLPFVIGPRLIQRPKGWKQALTSAMLVFGGGVLFATSLIHMFPEVSVNFTLNSKIEKISLQCHFSDRLVKI